MSLAAVKFCFLSLTLNMEMIVLIFSLDGTEETVWENMTTFTGPMLMVGCLLTLDTFY